jgi:hypothetical protein
METKDNLWARVTDAHWVHPKLGYIKMYVQFEAHPKNFLGPEKSFKTFEEAVRYMESFL